MAVTQLRDERKAIEAMFNTAWAFSGATPIKWENVESPELLTQDHVALSIRRAGGEQISLGSSPEHRYYGIVFIQVFSRSGLGVEAVEAYADFATAAFIQSDGRQKQISSGSTGRITFGLPEVDDEPRMSGGFYTLTVAVPFHRDQTLST